MTTNPAIEPPQPVSAATITAMTLCASFNRAAKPVGAPPSVEALIEDALARMKRPAVKAEFKKLLDNVPAGFALVPVLYSRINPAQSPQIRREFMFTVRTRFMAHIAHHHAQELSAMGICAFGIDRMKRGLEPTNDKGRTYNVNIDHIVECAGSGSWGDTRALDKVSGLADPTYRVNHFANLMLMPEEVHHYKNMLKDLQDKTDIKQGENSWVLMLTPLRPAGTSGYVCPPQKQGSSVTYRPETPAMKLSEAMYKNELLLNALQKLHAHPVVSSILKSIELVSYAEGVTVADTVNQNRGDLAATIRAAFTDTVSRDPSAQKLADVVALEAADAREMMARAAMASMSNLGQQRGRNEFKAFTDFFEGHRVAMVRALVALLPMVGTCALHTDFKALTATIEKNRRHLGPIPAANDNTATAKPAPARPQKKPPKKKPNGNGRF